MQEESCDIKSLHQSRCSSNSNSQRLFLEKCLAKEYSIAQSCPRNNTLSIVVLAIFATLSIAAYRQAPQISQELQQVGQTTTEELMSITF